MKQLTICMLLLSLVLSGCGGGAAETIVAEGAEPETFVAESEVDYDLTEMSSEMVYATVYQMLVNPEAYEGKTVRMAGQYYAVYYDVTAQYYHYCIIADASACCSQGMEFVWEGGLYPDDYPETSTDIVVVGTFGTYEELGITYCCLLDATLSV